MIVTYQKADGTRVDVKHGGGIGGQQPSFSLGSDEYINEMGGKAGLFITQLYFKTNKGRQYGPYGTAGGGEFSAVVKGQACGFSGTQSDRLFKICMHFIAD